VELIASYVEENDIEREDRCVVRTVVKKSSNKVHIIQNIDKRLPLESIAKAKGLTHACPAQEMETIVMSGTKLDINYHLDEVLEARCPGGDHGLLPQAESDSLELPRGVRR
jgi:ATP-dependent DNA helicase RecQ